MGGKFYINSKNRPCFQLENSVEEEIKTDLFPGLKVRVANRERYQKLVSGEYLELGDIEDVRQFTDIVVPGEDFIPVFAGEFTVTGADACLIFPSNLKWDSFTPENLEINKTYQYFIYNGLGTLKQVSRRSGIFNLISE